MQYQIVCRNYQQCAVRNEFRRVPSPVLQITHGDESNSERISDIGLSRWISARDFCNADELGCREAIKHVDELLGCFHTSWVWLNMVYGYWLIQIDWRLMDHEDNGP